MALKKKIKKTMVLRNEKVGFNYRITDFQCALGISQLSRLDKFVTRRKKISTRVR